MLVKPTVPELLRASKKNRYSLVIATAKRARQISAGSKVMVNDDDTSPVTLAADEIGEGKIKIFENSENLNNNNQESENTGSEEIK